MAVCGDILVNISSSCGK